MGWAARLRTLACRTWWFCCCGFHRLPFVGVVTNTDTGLPLLPPPLPLLLPSLWWEFVDGEWIADDGVGSLDDVNPMAFSFRSYFYARFACHTTLIIFDLALFVFRNGEAAAFRLHGRCRRRRRNIVVEFAVNGCCCGLLHRLMHTVKYWPYSLGCWVSVKLCAAHQRPANRRSSTSKHWREAHRIRRVKEWREEEERKKKRNKI